MFESPFCPTCVEGSSLVHVSMFVTLLLGDWTPSSQSPVSLLPMTYLDLWWYSYHREDLINCYLPHKTDSSYRTRSHMVLLIFNPSQSRMMHECKGLICDALSCHQAWPHELMSAFSCSIKHSCSYSTVCRHFLYQSPGCCWGLWVGWGENESWLYPLVTTFPGQSMSVPLANVPSSQAAALFVSWCSCPVYTQCWVTPSFTFDSFKTLHPSQLL